MEFRRMSLASLLPMTAPPPQKLSNRRASVSQMCGLSRTQSEFNLRKVSSLTVPMEDVKKEEIASNPFLRAKLKAFMGHLNTKVTPADENELTDSVVDPSMPADPMQKMTLRRYTAQMHRSNQNMLKELKLKLNQASTTSNGKGTIEI